jgi:hypothetical protein
MLRGRAPGEAAAPPGTADVRVCEVCAVNLAAPVWRRSGADARGAERKRAEAEAEVPREEMCHSERVKSDLYDNSVGLYHLPDLDAF